MILGSFGILTFLSLAVFWMWSFWQNVICTVVSTALNVARRCNMDQLGVIVLEDLSSGEAIWSLVSENSNPFDQIEVKAGYVLILSSSGTLFRFCEELQNFTLSVP